MDVRYSYYRDDSRRPLITLCRVVQGAVSSYGWAICSALDAPDKRKGRAIARQRALSALTLHPPDTRKSGSAGGMILAHDSTSHCTVVSWVRRVVRKEAVVVANHCYGPQGQCFLDFARYGISHLPKDMWPAFEFVGKQEVSDVTSEK